MRPQCGLRVPTVHRFPTLISVDLIRRIMDISGIKGLRRALPTWQNHAYNARLKH